MVNFLMMLLWLYKNVLGGAHSSIQGVMIS